MGICEPHRRFASVNVVSFAQRPYVRHSSVRGRVREVLPAPAPADARGAIYVMSSSCGQIVSTEKCTEAGYYFEVDALMQHRRDATKIRILGRAIAMRRGAERNALHVQQLIVI